MKAAVFDGKEITIKEVSKPRIRNSQVLVHVLESPWRPGRKT